MSESAPAVAVAVLASVTLGALAAVAPPGSAQGAPAPARADVAFPSSGRIQLIAADGTNPRRLTRRLPKALAEGADFGPDWSPDGAQLAFVSVSYAKNGSSQIVLTAADGSGRRVVTQPERSVQEPTWSPDGTRLAFARVARKGRKFMATIVVRSLASGEERVAVERDASVAELTEPAWSPDGERIAYTMLSRRRGGGQRSEIWSSSAGGGDARRLLGHAISPAWSPDGRRLAFSGLACPSGRCPAEIAIAGSDGSGRTRLTRKAGDARAPDWTADGRIVFASNRTSPGTEAYEIYSIGSDGSCLSRLTNGNAATLGPAARPGLTSSDPGRCGDRAPRPLVEDDPSARARLDRRRPAFWVGNSFGGQLNSGTEIEESFQGTIVPGPRQPPARRTTRRSLLYDDCSRFEAERCEAPLAVSTEPVCQGFRERPFMRKSLLRSLGEARFRRRRGALVAPTRGGAALSVLTGASLVEIAPAGRRRLTSGAKARALGALRRLRFTAPRPASALPAPRVPRLLAGRLRETRAAFQRLGGARRAARTLGVSARVVRARLRLLRALRSFGALRTVPCG